MSGKGKRTIVVTGATKGLGLALANQFAGLGHCVLGCGRTASAVEDLRAKFGPGHDFSVVNVSQREQVEAWSKRLLAAFGPPDLLLNNAALINQNAALWDVPAEEFDALIDVNIKGVFYVMKAFVPAMAERGSGVVINFSSGWGRSVAADVAPYLATKWAVEGLSRAAAQEAPHGLAVVPVNPGIVDTEMLRTCFGDSAQHYPSADDWARLAAPFLLEMGPKDNGKPLSVPT